MAGTVGNKTITNGLIYHIDFKNSHSWPGSGSTWTDLAGGKKGSLINGPTAYPTFMFFDGANDRMNTDITIQPAASSNLQTFCSWAYTNTGHFFGSNANGTGQFHLIVDWYYGDLRFAASYYGGGGETDYVVSVPYLSTIGWSYVCLVKTAANYFDVYFNGLKVLSNIYRNSSNSSQLQLGTFWDGYYQYQHISQIQVYNRALTSSEVLQNWNTMKKRYGIS